MSNKHFQKAHFQGLQYTEGTAVEALEKGLTDLMDLCDVVAEKFIIAREEFDDQMASKETASS